MKLFIGGGFNLFHKDHRKFIEKSIGSFVNSYGNLDKLIIGLISDEALNKLKGESRPFFSYNWRKTDLENFLVDYNSEIVSCGTGINDFMKLDKDTSITLRSDHNYFRILSEMGYNINLVDSEDNLHTTDIIESLENAKTKSGCQMRSVGALLIRSGVIVDEGYSGNGNCYTCEKKSSMDFLGYSSHIACKSIHAEQMALRNSQQGDDLLITCSPCQMCAQDILEKGIRRVVYTQKYYDTKPIEFLEQKGISIRKVGL